MKSTIAVIAIAAAQFADPYDRFVRDRVVRNGAQGEVPLRQFGGATLPMRASAGNAVLDSARETGFYGPWAAPGYVRNYGAYPWTSQYYGEAPFIAQAPLRPGFEAGYWPAGYPDSQRRVGLDIVNQDNSIDQYGNQAGALEALNRARANAGSLTTKDSLTPTAITSERTYVGPKTAADQGYKQAGTGAFRNTASAANRANKAGANTLEPIYIA